MITGKDLETAIQKVRDIIGIQSALSGSQERAFYDLCPSYGLSKSFLWDMLYRPPSHISIDSFVKVLGAHADLNERMGHERLEEAEESKKELSKWTPSQEVLDNTYLLVSQKEAAE